MRVLDWGLRYKGLRLGSQIGVSGMRVLDWGIRYEGLSYVVLDWGLR